jgi:hypothetical protein
MAYIVYDKTGEILYTVEQREPPDLPHGAAGHLQAGGGLHPDDYYVDLEAGGPQLKEKKTIKVIHDADTLVVPEGVVIELDEDTIPVHKDGTVTIDIEPKEYVRATLTKKHHKPVEVLLHHPQHPPPAPAKGKKRKYKIKEH